jgi:hypothetical protein
VSAATNVEAGRCHCGCGGRTSIAKKTNRRFGHVRGEPVRYVTGHHTRKSPHEYEATEGGCWIWQKGVSGNGYGMAVVERKAVLAHRLVYERLVGEIPEGYHLHHVCGNRSCVNPDHLEPMDPEDHNRMHGHWSPSWRTSA